MTPWNRDATDQDFLPEREPVPPVEVRQVSNGDDVEVLIAYRTRYPRSRRTKSTAIVHSGGKQTIRNCVCGSEHTESTRHRGKTKHVREWLAAHEGCMRALIAAQRTPPYVGPVGTLPEVDARLVRRLQ